MIISALSKQYVLCPVTATINGAAADPTSDAVEVAIVASGTAPVDGDFVAASWEPGTTSIRLLVGPDSAYGALDVGFYDVWSRTTDNPEIPVLPHGMLQVI